jgi:hypothetical protein
MVRFKKEVINLKRNLFWDIKYMFTGYKMQNFLGALRKNALKNVLLVVFGLSLIYVSLHPLDKLKLKYFFTRDFTIEMSARPTSSVDGVFLVSDKEILIDGDWMQMNSLYYHLRPDEAKYYHFEDGKVYYYYKDFFGVWHQQLRNNSSLESGDSMIGAELLDRRNYRRSKDNFFVWELKPEASYLADELSLTNLRVRRVDGMIAIVGDSYSGGVTCEVSICFTKFGTTRVTPPWEDPKKQVASPVIDEPIS